MNPGKASFTFRHTGHEPDDIKKMLDKIGVETLDQLIEKTIPAAIRPGRRMNLPVGLSEQEYLSRMKDIASMNRIFKSYIGMGYYGTFLPPAIQRNILENPSWYTSYTPYQAEISQGRLEALLNFQTVITQLTGMEIANASLLDEGTAAAEAMIMFYNARGRELEKRGADSFFVDVNIFPQTIQVVMTRARALGIKIVTGDYREMDSGSGKYFGALVQYPAGDGSVKDYSDFAANLHSGQVPLAVAADIMSLVLLKPPASWGADVVVGSTQRFGIPMGYGGPHAAYFAATAAFKRFMPGRIIGISIDKENRSALRMALQTREQHIKREKATSNICTSQALLAIMAGMYAVYHGYEGLKSIAEGICTKAANLSQYLQNLGYRQVNKDFFDTLHVYPMPGYSPALIRSLALERNINFRYFDDGSIGISLDETTSLDDLAVIADIFSLACGKHSANIGINDISGISAHFLRTDRFLDMPLFKRFRSETEFMRYIKFLERKDYSLMNGMISLGSCTMKLNAAAEMMALTWHGFSDIHPFVPADQAKGYQVIFDELSAFLKEITGFRAISFQPNSGAAGEYAGLLVIKKYLEDTGQNDRNTVLIPSSAHGTNPASAAMAGLDIVVVKCDSEGNIDIGDLKDKAMENSSKLAAFMVTYPSTHGVFESAIKEMTEIVHRCGGQVYMDGANMNAQVGLTNPFSIGADICHLNLHKTFAIPHGGGGPGTGPILAAPHLAKYLPSHPVVKTGGEKGISAVSSAPYGSASILVISHAYCSMMGGEGLTFATKIAILNANYLAACLNDTFQVLYKGAYGMVGHEMILDCRKFKAVADITESDIAKRLMDYGFHAPTLSFPVHGTLMVEPTESESLHELNRFTEAMLSIHKEIINIAETGEKTDNLLKNAPHTERIIAGDKWDHPYTRWQAAFPVKNLENNKFWPAVSRVDDAYGDRNLFCTCYPVTE